MTPRPPAGPRRGYRAAMPRVRSVAYVVAIIWGATWIAMGFAVAREVRDLASLSDTVVSLGQATTDAGDALAGLQTLPVIGERVRRPAETIRQAGTDAVSSARQSRRSAERLGLLLGLSVAVIPNVAVAGLFFKVPRSRVQGPRARAAEG